MADETSTLWGGDNGFLIFALLLLFFGFGGNGGMFGSKTSDRTATVEDLNNSANFTRLENEVQNNGNRVETKNDAIINGIASLGYDIAGKFGDLGSKVDSCCCTTQRAIDSVKYDNLVNSNAVTAALVADGEKTRALVQKGIDIAQQDKIASLQAEINSLKTQQMLCGVVRYPTSATYSYPTGNPFFTGTSLG